jgi:hypothetical protein
MAAAVIGLFPDAESALLYFLVPAFPDVRFVTHMPAGDLEIITARIHRISGANRDIYLDRPIIDIDVFGPSSQKGNTSQAAREIQNEITLAAGNVVTNGVIQHASTIVGPREVFEENPEVVRYAATYEILLHA